MLSPLKHFFSAGSNGAIAFNESISEVEAFSNTLLEKTLTVSNNGGSVIDGLVLSIDKDAPVFAGGTIRSATTCGSVLAAGEMCSVFIEATPQVIGAASANVQLLASKLDAISTMTVPVSIFGTP